MYNTQSKQHGPTVKHGELYSISCSNLNGKESEKEYMHVYVYKTESLCCKPETVKLCKSTVLQWKKKHSRSMWMYVMPSSYIYLKMVKMVNFTTIERGKKRKEAPCDCKSTIHSGRGPVKTVSGRTCPSVWLPLLEPLLKVVHVSPLQLPWCSLHHSDLTT